MIFLLGFLLKIIFFIYSLFLSFFLLFSAPALGKQINDYTSFIIVKFIIACQAAPQNITYLHGKKYYGHGL